MIPRIKNYQKIVLWCAVFLLINGFPFTTYSQTTKSLTAKLVVPFQTVYATNQSGAFASGAQTNDNGHIIAGTVTDTLTSSTSMLLLKTRGNGQLEFAKTFRDGEFNSGNSVQQTAEGGFIIAGMTGTSGAGFNSALLVKTNSAGKLEWSQTYSGMLNPTSTTFIREVKQTADSGFVMVGRFNSQVVPTINFNVYLIRTDASGNLIFARTYGGDKFDGGASVIEASDGGFVIAGTTESFRVDERDVYLIKTAANGDIMWTSTFGGMENDEGFSVQKTVDGGFIIVGSTSSFRGFQDKKIYLIKTDSMGVLQWSKAFLGLRNDVGNSVQQTQAGGFVITGRTRESFLSTSNNIFLLTTDGSGKLQFVKEFGRDGDEDGLSVNNVIGPNGFIITGITKSFDAGMTNQSLFNFYLIRTDINGISCQQKPGNLSEITLPTQVGSGGVVNDIVITTSTQTLENPLQPPTKTVCK